MSTSRSRKRASCASVYRGDGLMIDGSHDQRSPLLDVIGGFAYGGKLPKTDLMLRGRVRCFPCDVPTYGPPCVCLPPAVR